MRVKKIRITTEPLFYLYIALFILLLPIRWFIAWALAVILHEFGHWIFVRFYGNNVYAIRLKASGVEMVTDDLLPVQECLCAFAGPLASLLGALFIRRYPVFGAWCIIQFCYNMIPISQSDGSRVVRCVFVQFFGGDKGLQISNIVERLCSCILIIVVVWTAVRLNALFLILWLVFFVFVKRKIPCKQSYKRVQ